MSVCGQRKKKVKGMARQEQERELKIMRDSEKMRDEQSNGVSYPKIMNIPESEYLYSCDMRYQCSSYGPAATGARV